MNRTIPLLDLKAQYLSIKNEIDAAITSVIRDSAFVKGKYVESFEHNFAQFIGVEHCIGVGNGTDALFIALKCLGIGAGDEVIVPANSFIATSEAVTLSGAKVVFADCTEGTYVIDPEKIERAITPRTKAVIPVHLYGQPAPMKEIMEVAKKHNVMVIEDAAQAHGAVYDGKNTGTFGRCATFSFFPAKNLGAYGDGGAIVTSDGKLAEKMRLFANHGRKSKYDHAFEGVNSRLDGLQAAILDVKLRHLNEWVDRRNAVAQAYTEKLKGIVVTPKTTPGTRHAYHLYVIQTDKRDELREVLKGAGIETGIHYPIPLHLLEAYGYLHYKRGDFPVAERLAGRILSLPMSESMAADDVEYVASHIRAFLHSSAR